MKHAITTSYVPPNDASGVVALMALDQWLETGLKLEEGKHGLGFPFMYLLLTGTMGLKVPCLDPALPACHVASRLPLLLTAVRLLRVSPSWCDPRIKVV